MKLAGTPAQFLTLSKQLIAASPATTKVTVTYHADVPGKGTVTLKTYDPATGVVIKFRTNKVADVGRMVGTLGRVGRVQAGLKDEEPEPETATDGKMEGVETERKEELPVAGGKVQVEVRTGGGAGGKKKGKKGKR